MEGQSSDIKDVKNIKICEISPRSCSSCQKRKRKCDRVLPKCGTCIKYGRECFYELKQPPCDRCAKLKSRCSRDVPACQRCVSKGLKCEYPYFSGEGLASVQTQRPDVCSEGLASVQTKRPDVSSGPIKSPKHGGSPLKSRSKRRRVPKVTQKSPSQLEQDAALWAEHQGFDIETLREMMRKRNEEIKQKQAEQKSLSQLEQDAALWAEQQGFDIKTLREMMRKQQEKLNKDKAEQKSPTQLAQDAALWAEKQGFDLKTVTEMIKKQQGDLKEGQDSPKPHSGGSQGNTSQCASPPVSLLFPPPSSPSLPLGAMGNHAGVFMQTQGNSAGLLPHPLSHVHLGNAQGFSSGLNTMLMGISPKEMVPSQMSTLSGSLPLMGALQPMNQFLYGNTPQPSPTNSHMGVVNAGQSIHAQLLLQPNTEQMLSQVQGKLGQLPLSDQMTVLNNQFPQFLSHQSLQPALVTNRLTPQTTSAMKQGQEHGFSRQPYPNESNVLNTKFSAPSEVQPFPSSTSVLMQASKPEKQDSLLETTSPPISSVIRILKGQRGKEPVSPKVSPCSSLSSRSNGSKCAANAKEEQKSSSQKRKAEGQDTSLKKSKISKASVGPTTFEELIEQASSEFSGEEKVISKPLESSKPSENTKTESIENLSALKSVVRGTTDLQSQGLNAGKSGASDFSDEEQNSLVLAKPSFPAERFWEAPDEDESNVVHVYSLSPSHNRLPAPSKITGSKCSMLLSAFFIRYTRSFPFLADTEVVQKAIDGALCGPGGMKRLSETTNALTVDDFKERGNHASMLAAIGMGAFQQSILDASTHKVCYNAILQTLQLCSMKPTEEVIRAHGFTAAFCLITNQLQSFIKHFGTFNDLIKESEAKVDDKILALQTYLAIYIWMKKEDETKSDIYIWKILEEKANQFCCLEKDFPQIYKVSKSKEPSKLSAYQKHILFQYMTLVPSQALPCLCLPILVWVRKVLIDDETSDNMKIQSLEEVVKFICVASTFYKCKVKDFLPNLKGFLLSIQTMLMFLAGQSEKAKTLLKQQVQLYVDDPLYCVSVLTTSLKHHAHFLCMALSTLEMHSSYQSFQQAMNSIAHFFGLKGLPVQPPISNHGVCEEPECMLIWQRLAIPDIPDFLSSIDLSQTFWDVM